MNPYDSNDQTFRFKSNFGDSVEGILHKQDQPGTEDLRDDLRKADDQQEVLDIVVNAVVNDEISHEESVALLDQLEEIRGGNKPGVGADAEAAGLSSTPSEEKDAPGELKGGVEDPDVEQKADPEDISNLGDEEGQTLGDSVNSRWGENRTNGSGEDR